MTKEIEQNLRDEMLLLLAKRFEQIMAGDIADLLESLSPLITRMYEAGREKGISELAGVVKAYYEEEAVGRTIDRMAEQLTKGK